jgi:hypothetical protein
MNIDVVRYSNSREHDLLSSTMSQQRKRKNVSVKIIVERQTRITSIDCEHFALRLSTIDQLIDLMSHLSSDLFDFFAMILSHETRMTTETELIFSPERTTKSSFQVFSSKKVRMTRSITITIDSSSLTTRPAVEV